MAVHSIKQPKTKFDQHKPLHYRSSKSKTTPNLTYTTTEPNSNHTKPNHNNQTITYHIELNQTKKNQLQTTLNHYNLNQTIPNQTK